MTAPRAERKYSIRFEPYGISTNTADGTGVLELAERLGIAIRSECGGRGICGKCMIVAHPRESLSLPTEAEHRSLGRESMELGYRLACQARIEGSVTIEVPIEAVDSGEASPKSVLSGQFHLNPEVRRIAFDKIERSRSAENSVRDISEYVERRLSSDAHPTRQIVTLQSLKGLGRPFVFQGPFTVIHHSSRGVRGVMEGLCTDSLGVALDLGTTTLAAYLCDLTSGRIVAAASAANPQRRHGEDVITRISFASKGSDGVGILQRLMIGGVEALIQRCLDIAGAQRDSVDEVVVVGNTTMLQTFTGLDCRSLGLFPYLPVHRHGLDLDASDLGLDLPSHTNIHLLPVVSAFVGADTIAAVVSQEMHRREELTLLVDIGTNGELVLGNRDGLWATSCATGPAFEGGHLSCGMRATPGAIQSVSIETETKAVRWTLIPGAGSELPLGLCGSGVVDAIAEMLRAGILLPSGRLREGAPGVVLDEQGIGRAFQLVSRDAAGCTGDIVISLGDVRQTQLAKAALETGIKFLLAAADVSHVDRLVLTGAFGARFNWRSAMTMGMLPDAKTFDSVEVVENAAGLGAVQCLMDTDAKREAEELCDRIANVDLATVPRFQHEFAMATRFPEQAETVD